MFWQEKTDYTAIVSGFRTFPVKCCELHENVVDKQEHSWDNVHMRNVSAF